MLPCFDLDSTTSLSLFSLSTHAPFNLRITNTISYDNLTATKKEDNNQPSLARPPRSLSLSVYQSTVTRRFHSALSRHSPNAARPPLSDTLGHHHPHNTVSDSLTLTLYPSTYFPSFDSRNACLDYTEPDPPSHCPHTRLRSLFKLYQHPLHNTSTSPRKHPPPG